MQIYCIYIVFFKSINPKSIYTSELHWARLTIVAASLLGRPSSIDSIGVALKKNFQPDPPKSSVKLVRDMIGIASSDMKTRVENKSALNCVPKKVGSLLIVFSRNLHTHPRHPIRPIHLMPSKIFTTSH